MKTSGGKPPIRLPPTMPRGGVPSAFPRPTGVRQITATQAINQRAIEVSTFDELVNAVGTATVRGQTSTSFAPAGTEIIIIAPILFERTIVIPYQCQGLIIRSTGVIPCFSGGDIDFAFTCKAFGCQFLNLRILSGASGSFIGFLSVDFTEAQAAADAAGITVLDTRFVVDSCVFDVRSGSFHQFVETSADTGLGYIQSARVTNNLANAGGTAEFVHVTGPSWIITGNTAFGFTDFVTTVAPRGGACVIIGNSCDSSEVDTTAGSGRNVIDGNTGFDDIFNQITDRVGLNS